MVKNVEYCGRAFGKLAVLKAAPSRKGKRMWLCHCECGNEVLVTTGNLTSGNTKSCGCTSTARIAALNRTHGRSSDAEFGVWMTMKTRCCNRKFPQYDDYGGRGISVCERWKNSFSHFLADMGSRPSASHSIERADVNGNYEPANCTWATKITQANNARSNVRVTHNGRTMTCTQWSREVGVSDVTIRSRAHKGLPPEDVLYKGNLKTKYAKGHTLK